MPPGGVESFEGGDPTAGYTRFQKTSIGDGDVQVYIRQI